MLGMELRKVPVDDELRMRVDGYDLDDVAASSRPSARRRSPRSIRCASSPSGRMRPARGSTSTRRTRAPRGSARRSAGRRTASSSPTRLVVNPHKWLLVPMDCSLLWTARPDEWREAFSLVARVPAHARRRVRALGLRPGARPPLPLAQALGRAALLRRRRPAGDPARAHPACGALRRLGRGRARLGARRAAAFLARRLPPERLGRGERAILERA